MTCRFLSLRSRKSKGVVTGAVLALALGLSPQAWGVNGVLGNECLRLEISDQDGAIVSVLHKKSQTEYVSDAKRARLFRLAIPQLQYLARRIESRGQKAESVTVADGALTVRFHGLQISPEKYVFQSGIVTVPEPRLPIDVTVVLRLDGEHIIGTMTVENHSLEQITDVIFPWITSLAALDGKPGRIVLPSLSDKIKTATSDFLVGERGERYPSMLAAAWVQYEGEGKGIGIESRSPPETQDALISLTRNTIQETSPSYWDQHDFPYIGWAFYPHIAGQSRWDSPEVVIHVHDSDWRTMAGEHREWYRQQFKPPQSAVFRDAIGFATYRLKKQDDTINWKYAQIPRLAEVARSAGMDHLVLSGWRQQESPANPVPFAEIPDPRLGGGVALKQVVDSLHHQGVELIFTFHPTLINTAPEKYREEIERWTVKSRRQANQTPVSHTFFTVDYPYQEQNGHYWAAIDPSTGATDFLLESARRLKDEYGFRNLFLRGVGLQSFLSYNHESAAEPQRKYVEGYRRFLGGLQEALPGFLMMEGLNDLVNPYSAAGYTWYQTTNAEVLALSIPWTPFSTDIEALEYEEANAAFARKILINLIVDGGDGTVERYPEFAQHLKRLRELKKATLPYYADAEFRDHEGLQDYKPDPGAVISVFHNRDTGQTGVVLANLTADKKEVPLALSRQPLGRKGRLVRFAGLQEEIELPAARIELAPYEVVVVCLDPEPGESR